MQRKRIALTVPHELDDLLNKLSVLQGIPKTKIIIDIFEQAHPYLKQALENYLRHKSVPQVSSQS